MTTKTNKDGFVPGQQLSHADLMALRAKNAKAEPKAAKRATKADAEGGDE
ncbi:hypothetical protein JF540_22905 [Salipiger thiooxidans]|nr:hypothetical protein [Salipiger thiooxidans]MBN8189539.1 hypothetical protein [Salipiger thiooxidans]